MISWIWLPIVAAMFGMGGFLLCAIFVAKGRDDRE